MSGFEDFIDISGDGGLLKKITKEGAGDSPQPGDEVRAHYTGTLDDGTKFDSSYDRGTPFKFRVGKNKVRQMAPIRRPLGCRLAMFPRLCLRCHC